MAAAQKSRGVAPLPAKLAGLLREAKWLALVAAAGYLLLILLTHHATDPSFTRSATAAVVQNAGGLVGAKLSDFMLMLFGWSAFWWVVLCLYTVVRGYRRIESSERIEARPLIAGPPAIPMCGKQPPNPSCQHPCSPQMAAPPARWRR